VFNKDNASRARAAALGGICLISGLTLLSACGADDAGREYVHSPEAKPLDAEAFESGYIPQLSLSATEGVVVVKAETLLKATTGQGASLGAAQKCALSAGTQLVYSAVGATTAGHRLVTLAQPIAGCALKAGYVFEGHVAFESRKTWFALPTTDTKFKARLADSSALKSSEVCNLESGRKYRLAGEPSDAGSGHDRVNFASGELPSCGFSSGFLFSAHFDNLLEAPRVEDFPRVMKHILLWEGGCSDHPNDLGGRTFKGITTGRARQNGWTRDVCTMPDSMILQIYRNDYWNNRAIRYPWPLNLAIMNTEVNSGGGRAQIFLDRMAAQGIGGTPTTKAAWYVDQQSAFYRAIVANNPSQRVFLTGWLNRSAHMQDVIAGRRSLMGENFAPGWTAKALAD
jgi:hypothetical protein